MKKSALLSTLLLQGAILFAQNPFIVEEPGVFPPAERREIIMPKLDGFEIMKGDFHMHTVFPTDRFGPKNGCGKHGATGWM